MGAAAMTTKSINARSHEIVSVPFATNPPSDYVKRTLTTSYTVMRGGGAAGV